MNTERRFLLFLVFTALFLWVMPPLLQRAGLMPKPPVRPPVAKKEAPKADAAPPGEAKVEPGQTKDAPEGGEVAAGPKPAAVEVSRVDPSRLVLGSTDPKSPYFLEAQFTQTGGGLATLRSSRIEAEVVEGQPRNRPLTLLSFDPKNARGGPPSLVLDLIAKLDPKAAAEARKQGLDASEEDVLRVPLGDVTWEAVVDADGSAVRTVERQHAGGKAEQGQEIAFRTVTGPLLGSIEVTKQFRLWPGENGLEMAVELSRAEAGPKVSYELLGPRGLPIEGEWYTGTFRDVFIGGFTSGGDQIITRSAYDVVKNRADPERVTSLPIKYAGVENQYFASFLEPQPSPRSLDQSFLTEARGVVVTDDPLNPTKADVTVKLVSRPLDPAANRPVVHTYRVYGGPKTAEALSAYDAFELSTYRKGWHLPLLGDLGAQFMSKNVIAPMLNRTYAATAWVSSLFGGTRGSYGFAIILLTILVRLVLFPLGRKQARTAQKMQELQPVIAKLKEKYGDDKEKITRETFALYKQHGANPMAGCLPAIVQLPVLVGLWQALNNSVALRHSRFLWIDNLAAPDMLFRFPAFVPQLPMIGHALGPYFNILPIFVVGLMLVQTKLFSPPPTTPEAEQQQKMMKFMMIFMAFIFYKVPSGLGIYFITSSLWQIGERLLLPKGKPIASDGLGDTGSEGPGPSPRPAPRPAPEPSGAPAGGFWSDVRAKARERMEQVMEDAQKQRTVRNTDPAKGGKDRNRPRPPDRNRPRKP
jgi:YidC/Oxa1 family membrane protein insertase